MADDSSQGLSAGATDASHKVGDMMAELNRRALQTAGIIGSQKAVVQHAQLNSLTP